MYTGAPFHISSYAPGKFRTMVATRPIFWNTVVFKCGTVIERKSDGFTPNGGAKYKGGINFRPILRNL